MKNPLVLIEKNTTAAEILKTACLYKNVGDPVISSADC
jgi:hypothetical protein